MVTQKDKNKEKTLEKEIEILKAGKKAQEIEFRNTTKRLKSRTAKCEKLMQRVKTAKKELKALKSDLNALKKQIAPKGSLLGMECPKGHNYPLWLMHTGINMQVRFGQSYRQVKNSLSIMLILMGFNMKTPCIGTIRQWVQKFGKSELGISQENEAPKVLMVDESIGIGQEKVLLFLGIKAENWRENPSNLKHEDAMVVGLQTKKSWDGKTIAKNLQEVKFKVEYVVSDCCSTLKRAYELCGWVHVPDCTHFMGNLMKHHHEKQEGYEKLLSGMSKIRQRWGQSKFSAMITPDMRTKSKFLNLFAIADWLEKILDNWENLNAEEQSRVSFVQELSNYAKEMICMCKIIKQLSELLKTKGITPDSYMQIQNIFSRSRKESPTLESIEKAMLEYVTKVRASLPKENSILCCSDLIESYFGKFKYRNKKTNFQGITQDVLSMALFGANISCENVKNAMETTSWSDVNAWGKENLVDSFAKNKRNFWRKISPKIA